MFLGTVDKRINIQFDNHSYETDKKAEIDALRSYAKDHPNEIKEIDPIALAKSRESKSAVVNIDGKDVEVSLDELKETYSKQKPKLVKGTRGAFNTGD